MTTRFYDGHRAVPHRVSVRIEGGVLCIWSDDGLVAERWVASDLQATSSRDGVIAFRLKNGLSRLQVDDPALLAALRPIVGRWPRRMAGLRWGLAAAATAIGLTVLLVAVGPGVLAPLVPAAWEEQAGLWAETAVIAGHSVCRGAAGNEALTRVVVRLAHTAELAPMRLLVVDDRLVNAHSLPGRRILLKRGLIDAMVDGDELAGVLAHEVGHVANRDAARGVIRQLGLAVAGAAVGSGGLNGVEVAESLLGLSYSRSDEAAADAFAVATLRAAGLRADGLGRFFARMESQWPDGPSLLSDHPSTATRRALVTVPADGAPAFEASEWLAIRTMCARD